MELKSINNKYLIVKAGVNLNEKLDAVIAKLDKHFAEADHKAFVTSGIRNETDQLRIIKDYCIKRKIDDPYIKDSAINTKTIWEGKEIYTWQLAWSKLLNQGIIINPPATAEVLLDYYNRHDINRKGDKIQPSVHFQGRAFDIGGGANSVDDEKQILVSAIQGGGFPMITNFVVERQNNCLHVDVV